MLASSAASRRELGTDNPASATRYVNAANGGEAVILGIGVDTVENARVERALRTPGFASRIFTEAELALPLSSISARWAAREAAVKALGGLHGLTLRELAVQREHLAAPAFVLGERLRAVLAQLGIARLHLSLSHERNLATAFVIAEGSCS